MHDKLQVLEQILNNLESLEKEFIDSSKRIVEAGNRKLYAMDLFASTVSNRSIALLRGFRILAKDNNYISAVPLIRMQVDNALRFYAATLVSDYNAFFRKYIEGGKIKDIKDADGNKMNDSYLAKKLDEHFPGIKTLYNNTCDYIHLSHVHASINTEKVPDKERTIGIKIGNYDFFNIESKIDFSFNMQEASKILLVVVEQWKHEKDRLNTISE